MLTRTALIKEKLVDRFGLDKLPPEEFSELLEKIEEGLSYRMGAAVVEALTEGKQKIFIEMIDQKPEGEVIDWLKENIQDFDGLLDKLVEEHCADVAKLLES